MMLASAARRIPTRRSGQLFGELVNLVDTVSYVGVTLGTETGSFGFLLNRKSGLSIRNDLLL